MKRISTNMNNLRQSLSTSGSGDHTGLFLDTVTSGIEPPADILRGSSWIPSTVCICSWIDVCEDLNGSLSALPVPTAVRLLPNLYIHYNITIGTTLHQKHKTARAYQSAQLASKQQRVTTVVSHQSRYSDTRCTWIYFILDSKALQQPLSSTQRSTCLERLWGITSLAVTQGTWANQYRPGCE